MLNIEIINFEAQDIITASTVDSTTQNTGPVEFEPDPNMPPVN